MCLSVCTCVWKAKERTGTHGGTGVTDGFKPPNMGAGNQTWVLWKRNHLSSSLLLLSFPFERTNFVISPQTLLIQPWAWTKKATLYCMVRASNPYHDENTIPMPFLPANQEFHCRIKQHSRTTRCV